LSPLFRFAGGARERDADTAALFLGSRARDRERANFFFIARHSLYLFFFCDFFFLFFSPGRLVWFGLVLQCCRDGVDVEEGAAGVWQHVRLLSCVASQIAATSEALQHAVGGDLSKESGVKKS